MRVKTGIIVVVTLAVIAGGVLGLNLAPKHSLLGSVEVTSNPAAAASILGSWPAANIPKPKHPLSFEVADATVPVVPLYSSPGVLEANGQVMHNPTSEGLAVVFLVKGERGAWVYVEVSSRPNGFQAWVPLKDVSIRTVPNWIQIQLGARKATVFHGDTPLFQTTVAVGEASSPTPTGGYFVDGVVRLANPNGAYGYGQLSVSAFSNVYQTFGGGDGQIAMHGTNEPGLIGTPASHGCVRFTNAAIAVVMSMAPTGTPVEIMN